MRSKPTIRTERLILRPWREEDLAPVAAMNADPRVMEFRFRELVLDEIVSFTTPANARSTAVMRRLGMMHSPADDFDHPALPAGHALRRHALYRARPTTPRQPT